MMQIVTGYKGQAHITANDDQGRNQGTFGESSYVLSVGSKFAPTLLSANSLKIADGEGVHQGVHFRVDPGTYDTVTIDNGEQGKNRKDLVVCRYTKDGGTGIESCDWVVIKGTAVSGTATRPSHITGDILGGSLTVDMPFFEVALSGINVSAVTSLFTTVNGMATMQSEINTLNTNSLVYRGVYSGDLDATNIDLGVYNISNTATNVPGSITYGNFVQLPSYRGQLIYNATQMFFREFTGNPGDWKPWRKIVTAIQSNITVTAATNVTIDTNKSIVNNNTAYFYVKGHASAKISGGDLFAYSISGGSLAVSGFTFALGIGDVWDVTGVGYGYFGESTVSGRVDSGKYFHVVLCIPLS